VELMRLKPFVLVTVTIAPVTVTIAPVTVTMAVPVTATIVMKE